MTTPSHPEATPSQQVLQAMAEHIGREVRSARPPDLAALREQAGQLAKWERPPQSADVGRFLAGIGQPHVAPGYVRERLAVLRSAGIRLTPGDCAAIEASLPRSLDLMNTEILSEVYRFPGAGESLPTLAKDSRVVQHAKINADWQQRIKMEPPLGLSGHPCHGFRPHTFQWAVAALKAEAHGAFPFQPEEEPMMDRIVRNQYAYRLTCLFATPDRIARYVGKHIMGRRGNTVNPYNEAAQLRLPMTGGWSIPGWGDALLREGPAMARFVKYAKPGEKVPRHAREAAALYAPRAYPRGSEHPTLASLCLQFGMDEFDFEEVVAAYAKVDPVKASSQVPNIEVPGERFGLPGYVWRRADPGDPRILLAGHMVNCCQSIGGNADKATRHSATSPHGACYFLEKPAAGRAAGVAAVSWAWRGEEGELCFDSFEAIGPTYRTVFPALLQAIREELPRQAPNVTVVTVGCGGGTPKMPMPVLDRKEAPQPRGFAGYRDSRTQYLLASPSKEEDMEIARTLQSAKVDISPRITG